MPVKEGWVYIIKAVFASNLCCRVHAIKWHPLRLKGRSRIPSMCSSTTPLGASGLRARFVLVPSRVPPPRRSLLAACPWATPSGSSCCSLVSLSRRHLMPRFAACGLAFGWVRSPFFVEYFFFACSPIREEDFYRGGRTCFPVAVKYIFTLSSGCALLVSWSFRVFYMFQGSRTCFPGCVDVRRLESYTVRLPFCVLVSRNLFLPGRPDGFSRARLSVSSRFPCPRCARPSGMWSWITSSSTKCCDVSEF